MYFLCVLYLLVNFKMLKNVTKATDLIGYMLRVHVVERLFVDADNTG